MNRLIEILLGLDRGFLAREGDFSLAFNPQWPGGGTAVWNFALVVLGIALVFYVYRRDGRGRWPRVILASFRLMLIGLVLALLNRPTVTLTQSRIEPSVLAIAIDDSLSMRVADVPTAGDQLETRLAAVTKLLSDKDAAVVKELAKKHELKFYRFDADASAVATSTTQPSPTIEPLGQNTQVATSVRTILRDLQGRRLAGVVGLTDGRDMPQQSLAAAIDEVKDFGTPVFAIPVGSDQPPRNIELQQVSVEDAVFAKEIANIKATVRVTGPSAAPVVVRLKDKKTGKVMLTPEGRPIEATFTPAGDAPGEVELLFTPAEPGSLSLIVEAEPRAGEINTEDNAREIQLSVLDAKINILYVDGYPRWDYRYLKNEMIRDKTIDVSCLLLSAEASFRQEGDKPITRFPETAEEMLQYDVVLIGDVDPRELSDNQTQLIADFVGRRAGGFAMVAGPLFSPAAWKGTPIEAVLPVDVTKSASEDWGTNGGTLAEGFRPRVTKAGLDSGLFRFLPDKAENETFLKQTWQPLFWYSRNVMAKPGVGEVFAEHPTDLGPDGRLAPILVAGRYGAGRTAFLAVDDSWRWRYYTGESVFDTFWVQQLRYLARGRKLGERRMTLVSQKPVTDLGQQVRLTLRVIDPQLQTQLPPQLRVQIVSSDGTTTRLETLVRQEPGDTYLASFSADRLGKFTVKLAGPVPGVDDLTLPIEIAVPKLELSTPQVDRVALARLASETGGKLIELTDAAKQLPLIASAERRVPVISNQPVWNAPLALLMFVIVLTSEWIARKWFGMV
ncbi:MAG: hypothetical protein JWM57_3394 [Phycisphaerales bacterium]|nr:hypothetical protein [Phycisphaerales bacterium]